MRTGTSRSKRGRIVARVAHGFLIAVALLALGAAAAEAQIGVTTDIITGTVRAQNGQPVAGARVEVMSLETNVTRRATSNREGRYTILFPDGGGEYQVTIRAIGLSPVTMIVERVADEDRLIADATLGLTTTQLSTVAVQARQTPRAGVEVPTPGTVEQLFTPEQLARLPVDAADLLNLALLSSDVVAVAGTDTSAAGYSVAGLRPDANVVTLDGMASSNTQIPQEAVRATHVVTNTYDASRGQFSGGMIASTTRSGTNELRGNFGYALRDDDLVLAGEDSSILAQGYTQHQFSGGMGRAIVRDQLFIFGSFQIRRRDDVLPSLFNADPATLSRLGVHPDTTQRFFDIARGFGLSPAAYFEANRLQDNLSGLVRLDWLMPNGHSLSLRGDWRWSDQDPSRVGTLALPQTGGTNTSRGGGLMATHTSIFGDRYLNELKAYVSTSHSEARPLLSAPAGRVQVASDLTADDARGITTLTFGGNSGLPQHSTSRTLEVTDEVSWLTPRHRFKLGGNVNLSEFERDVTTNRFGTYTFNSLADFEAGRPASFTRTLQPTVREGSMLTTALHLADVWTPRRGLQITYGARVESGRFGNRPAYNPAVEQSFGYRTDVLPSEVHVSPRVGFTWTVGGGAASPGGRGGGGRGGRGGGAGGFGDRLGFAGRGGNAPLVIRGGVGEFRNALNSNLYSQVAAATGLANAEAQLVCTGDAVPVPDWSQFLLDPSSIPSECVDGGNSFVPTARPSVTVFDPGFEAPRAIRASLGAQRRLFDRYSVSVDLSWSRGIAQTGYRDINLQTTPAFTLPDEGGRPVFVPAATIVPTTGATNLLASRRDPAFSQVLVVGSDLESESKQLGIRLNGITGRGALFRLGYTLGYARDQSSGGRLGSGTTAGNPNLPEWAVSSFDRRHSFTASFTWPFNLDLELTATGRLTSGAPFTPMVGGDINGDGARNDRAFLFDPSSPTTDPAIAAAMTRLLGDAPAEIRTCLREQLGRVAARNSCRGVWQPSLELQLNWRPSSFGLGRRLMLSVNTQNLLGGIDELLHGANNLHGWGVYRGQDNTLLYVRGFDPATNRYLYEVNERFGASRRGQNGIRVPFQIGVNARLMVGPDRARDAIDAIRGAAFGRGGRGGGGPAAMATALANVNPVRQIVALRDSLALTEEQVAKLTAMADSLDAKNEMLADSVRRVVQEAGPNPNVQALMERLRPSLEVLQGNRRSAMSEVRAVLTAEQWNRLPARLRGGRGGRPDGP